MKKLVLFILLLVNINMLAQNYKVTSFKCNSYDLSATQNPRRDLNQKKCALIKVQSLDPIKRAEGNVIGDISSQYNESRIYIIGGSKYVKLFFENHTPLTVNFSDYTNERIDEGCTYELLLSDNIATDDNHKSQNTQNPNITINAVITKANNGNLITFVLNEINFFMKKCQGGTFDITSTSEQRNYSDNGSNNFDNVDDYSNNDNSEIYTRKVTVSDFYIGIYEVTQELWETVMGSNPSHTKGRSLPVEEVSWNDCQTFFFRLNKITGKNFRFPTEAEWEYAARGGNLSSGFKYSGSNKLKNVAWYDDTSEDKTHEVGAKSPNEMGLYDMSGNVWEWCEDEHNDENSDGNSGETYRAFRGGGWNSPGQDCKPSKINNAKPDAHYNFLGFRLALSE